MSEMARGWQSAGLAQRDGLHPVDNPVFHFSNLKTGHDRARNVQPLAFGLWEYF